MLPIVVGSRGSYAAIHTRDLLLLRRIARNGGFRLVSLVAAAASAEALESCTIISALSICKCRGWETYRHPSRARERVRRCSLRAGAGLRPAVDVSGLKMLQSWTGLDWI
jgi:hypothetical protein